MLDDPGRVRSQITSVGSVSPMADFLRKPPALPALKLLTTKILKVLTKFSTVLLDYLSG